MNIDTQIQQFRETFYNVKAEIQKRIVGQDAIIEGRAFLPTRQRTRPSSKASPA